MNDRYKYSVELNVWKFIFAVVIMLHHSEYLYGGTYRYFPGGSIGVEFFFITSGFLMAHSASKLQNTLQYNHVDLSHETWKYIRKKISAVYPYILLSFLISFIVYIFTDTPAFVIAAKNGFKAITELLLINWSGVVSFTVIGPVWFISAMLLSMAIMYPLILKYGKTFTKLICPLLAVFLLGYLKQKYGHFRTPSAWDGLFLKGMIRAFAEISLGVFCYECHHWLQRYRLSTFSKTVLTLLAYGFLALTLLIANTEKYYEVDASSVIVLGIAIIIIAGNRSLLSPILNRSKTASRLGSFSMVLYFNHRYISKLLGKMNTNWGLGPRHLLVLYIVLSFISALCCFGIVKLFQYIWRLHKNRIISLFLLSDSSTDKN